MITKEVQIKIKEIINWMQIEINIVIYYNVTVIVGSKGDGKPIVPNAKKI